MYGAAWLLNNKTEVMLMGDGDIPLELTEQDRWGGWVMARLDDG